MEASYRGYTETVKVLAEAKADPNITDKVKINTTTLTIVIVLYKLDQDHVFHYRMVTLLSCLLPMRVILTL